MASTATAPRGVALTLVGTAPPVSVRPAVGVRICTDDEVTRLGLCAQLAQAGVTILDAESIDPCAVTVFVCERFDERAKLQLAGIADGAPVLVVLTELDADAALTAMSHGATGVLRRRDLTAERLQTAVRGAGAGEVTFPVDLFTRMMTPSSRAGSDARCEPRISDRERDVLRLLAEGNSTREVADQLCYSERTIKNVLQDLSIRLDLRNRTHVVSHAIRHGWI